MLSLVTGVGALVSTVLNPVWGAFSDRTTLRVGRRLPWVLGGRWAARWRCCCSRGADTVWRLVLAWALAQASLNAMLAAITATVPDQVPVQRARRRGRRARDRADRRGHRRVRDRGGHGQHRGRLPHRSPSCWSSRRCRTPWTRATSRCPGSCGPTFRWGPFLRSFWVSPRQYPDFGVGLGHPVPHEPRQRDPHPLPALLPQGRGRTCPTTRPRTRCSPSPPSTAWSPSSRRSSAAGGRTGSAGASRFVIWSGLIAAAALMMFAFVHTMPAAYVGAVVLGIGFGAYTAVDFALITEVLPGGGRPRQGPRRHQHRQRAAAGARPGAAPRRCSGWGSATRACTCSPPRSACSARCSCAGSGPSTDRRSTGRVQVVRHPQGWSCAGAGGEPGVCCRAWTSLRTTTPRMPWASPSA